MTDPAFRFDAEEVSNTNWRRVKFGEMAECVTDRVDDPGKAGYDRYVGLEHLDADSLYIRRWGNPADLKSTKLLFKPGNIIFGKRNAYLRRQAVVDFAGVCSAHAMVLRAREDVVFKDFLPVFMQSDTFYDRTLAISVGSLSPTINWRDLAQQEFLLPPMEEQKRIAEILWAAEDLAINYTLTQNALNKLFNAAISTILEEQWPQIPCADLLVSKPRNGLSPDNGGEGLRCLSLSIGCIRNGSVIAEGNTKYSFFCAGQVRDYTIDRGDVLIVRGNGNKSLVGRGGLVTSNLSNYIYPDLLIRLKFNTKIIRPKFAVLQWNSNKVHSELLKTAKSTNGIWKVNGKDIASHLLFVPPIDIQDAFLEQYNLYEDAYQSTGNCLHSNKMLRSIICAKLCNP